LKLLNYNLTLKKIKKVDIIFFDNNYSKIKINELKILVFDYNEINLYLLFLTIIFFIKTNTKLSLKDIYLKKFIETSNAKIVIGHNFNDVMFRVNKLNTNVKIIVYLHNRLYLDQIKNLKKNNKNSYVDYFFVCDEKHKKILSKFIKGTFIVNGLIRNNEITLNKKKNIFDLMIISEYRGLPESSYYTKCIKFITKSVCEYAKLNSKKVVVALNSKRIEKRARINQKDEIKFYKKISKQILFHKKKFLRSCQQF